jgi:hypothetical protein
MCVQTIISPFILTDTVIHRRVYGIQSATAPACIHEILIDDVTRGLQGVILGDHRFTTLVRGISFGLTNSATLLFASARHTSTISLQLDDEVVFWRFPLGGQSLIILPDSAHVVLDIAY